VLTIRIIIIRKVIEDFEFTNDAVLDLWIGCSDTGVEYDLSFNTGDPKCIVECS